MPNFALDGEAGGVEFEEFGYNPIEETEQSLNGSKLSPEMMKKYVSSVQKRMTDTSRESKLMGRFAKKGEKD